VPPAVDIEYDMDIRPGEVDAVPADPELLRHLLRPETGGEAPRNGVLKIAPSLPSALGD
jgi:hypothetical protein